MVTCVDGEFTRKQRGGGNRQVSYSNLLKLFLEEVPGIPLNYTGLSELKSLPIGPVFLLPESSQHREMASILPALLLAFFLQYAPTYSMKEPCKIANAMMGGDFNLTIYPMYYKEYIHYNVTVSGFGENATIVLSSYFNGSAVGMWLNNATDCDGFKGIRSTYAKEQWVSPFTISDYVKIRAYVYTMNGTYVKNITLKQMMPMTTSPTNMTATTMNMTYTPMVYDNMTAPMNTTMYMNTTAGTTRTTVMTTNSAPGISSKPLQVFGCMLLLLVTVPGL